MSTVESEEHVPLSEEFVYCCGAATQVLKLGPWKDLWSEKSSSLLFLIVPGNPGILGYYKTFMEALYYKLNQQYPVWAVSHAGHCAPPRGMSMTEDTDVKEIEDVFGLNGQIEHKLFFLKKNVPEDMKLVLIGHSIGCYIVLELMKRASELQVLRSVLLFPTIERMAESPHGKFITPVLCKLRFVIYVPVYLLSFLPKSIKAYIMRFLLRGRKLVDETLVTTSLNLFNVNCLANIMYMGSQEMEKVVDRDSSTIRQHLQKIIFYYGAVDNWCPVQYYEEMKSIFPDGDIRLCEKGIQHAFVLDSSKEMASMITDWLQDDLSSL